MLLEAVEHLQEAGLIRTLPFTDAHRADAVARADAAAAQAAACGARQAKPATVEVAEAAAPPPAVAALRSAISPLLSLAAGALLVLESGQGKEHFGLSADLLGRLQKAAAIGCRRRPLWPEERGGSKEAKRARIRHSLAELDASAAQGRGSLRQLWRQGGGEKGGEGGVEGAGDCGGEGGGEGVGSGWEVSAREVAPLRLVSELTKLLRTDVEGAKSPHGIGSFVSLQVIKVSQPILPPTCHTPDFPYIHITACFPPYITACFPMSTSSRPPRRSRSELSASPSAPRPARRCSVPRPSRAGCLLQARARCSRESPRRSLGGRGGRRSSRAAVTFG